MSNIYAEFTEKILNLPLWVKEIVYFMLKQNLKDMLPCSNLDIEEENLYQYWRPEMTYAGKKEYERLKIGEPQAAETKFLQALTEGLSIIEITLNNAWTLEETSQLCYNCIEKQLVTRAENPIVNAKVAYFANKIRIGEYLKHIGLIDVDQLQNAMRIQKESEESNEKKGFASILVDLGLVTRDDTDNILLIKQESRRRFTLNFNSSSADENPNGTNSPVSLQSLEEKRQLDKLEYENKLLKAKLRQLLNLDKK